MSKAFNQRIKFTEGMIATIIAERAKEHPTPWRNLALMIGVGTGTILRWAYEAGFPTVIRPAKLRAFAMPEKQGRLRALWPDPTVSQAEIGRILGVERKSIVREAMRLELGPRPALAPRAPRVKPERKPRAKDKRAWPDAMLQRLRELRAKGLSNPEIGAQLGVSKSAVIGKARRLGLAVKRVPGGNAPPRPRRPRRQQSTGLLIGPTLPAVLASPPAPLVVLRPRAPQFCCWPFGEPRTKQFRFCGDPAIDGKSYCPGHYRAAYVPATPRRELADA